MPQSIDGVEEEGKRKEGFESDHNSRRPRSNGRNHRLRLHVPSSVRGGKVGESPEVQRAGEDDGREAVEARCVPGDLGLIYCEMRGDGAVDALLDEDFCGVGFGGCESIFIL